MHDTPGAALDADKIGLPVLVLATAAGVMSRRFPRDRLSRRRR
ncbi:MAG: hypothetical protein RLO52_26335 [Sandaracinaceae bacterium]